MIDWVSRIGDKYKDIRVELDKLRKKYESEEQRPAEFPNQALKFESLFPELREVDKIDLPPLSSDTMTSTERPPSILTPPPLPLSSEYGTPKQEMPTLTAPKMRPGETRQYLSPEQERLLGIPPPPPSPPSIPKVKVSRLYGPSTEEAPKWFRDIEDYALSFPQTPGGQVFGAVGILALVVFTGIGLAQAGWSEFLRFSVNRNLNAWAKSSGVEMPAATRNAFTNWAMNQLSRKWLSQQALKTVFNPTKGGWSISPQAAQSAQSEITALVKSSAQSFIPTATQTGAMAMGTRAGDLTKLVWDSIPVAQRIISAQSIGLAKEVGQKVFEALTGAEKIALAPVITKPTEVTPVAPSVPPEAPRAITGGVIPPTKGITPEGIVEPAEDPVNKLTQLIKSAKPVRAETELLKHEELSRRAGALASAIKTGEGEEAFLKAKGTLVGELPQAVFEPPRPQMTTNDLTGLFNTIRDSDLLPFQKLNTSEALSAILGGKLPTRGDIVLLENIFGSDLAKALLSKRPLSQKAWDVFLQVWNIPRSLMASGELSASLRQGSFLAPSHPKIWGRTMWAQLRAAVSEETAIQIDRDIQTNPRAELRAQYGVFHAPISGVGSKLTAREEVFISDFFEQYVNWWEKQGLITRVGTSPLYPIAKGVRISERAYITFLNKLRAEVFDTTVDTWERTGETPSPDELKRLANFVNNATGRGDLGKLEDSAPVLSGALFSPRLQASRIGLVWDAMRDTIRAVDDLAHGRSVNRMSGENLKAVVSFVGVGLMILGLAKLAGAEVETDSNSADFGKIKIGKTRIDIWGSFQPYARFISNMITGERKSTITGASVETSRMDILKSFVRSKLMPTTGFIWDVLEGRTYRGEDIEFNVEQVAERLAPMFWQDMYDALKEEGLIGGAMVAPLGLLGVGIQTYDLPSWPELEEYFNIEDSKQRVEWRINNPENEAKLFILGRLTTIKTPLAAEEVIKLVAEHKIDPSDIRAVEQWQAGAVKHLEQGTTDENITLTDTLIQSLLSGIELPAEEPVEEKRAPERYKLPFPPSGGESRRYKLPFK